MTENLERYRRYARTALAVGGLAGGAALGGWLILTKPQPAKSNSTPLPPMVEVVAIEPQAVTFPVVGHGTVRPKRQVNIIPQISGALTYIHPNLAQGKVIPKGEVLFEVERVVYEARQKQAIAESRGLEAAIARQEKEIESLAIRIENAQRMLAIDESDYQTSKQLYETDKVGTQRDVDVLNLKYLRTKDALAELEAQRTVLPLSVQQTRAQLDAANARLAQVEHDLAETRIVCPFKARVESVQANVSQVVTAFFSIATLTEMEAFEMAVGVDPRELRWLADSIHPNELDDEKGADGPRVAVSWSLRDQEFRWPGYVSRFERVDEATRTAKMVVEVRDSDMTAQVVHGGQELSLDLAIGMFCRAELPGRPLMDAMLVPRHAIYDDRFVYAVQRDPGSKTGGHLVEREISMLRAIGNQVLISYHQRGEAEVCQVQPGDFVVTTPLAKPVNGMSVRVREAVATNHNPLRSIDAEPVDEAKLSLMDSVIKPSVLAMVPELHE